MKIRYFVVLLALLLASINLAGQTNVNREENVIVQMNYCINTLTNIIHNKSISVLEHEIDQLVNNLTMEQIIGLPEIRDFRIDLMDAASKFEITEEERMYMRRLQSMKRDNAMWNALSAALNPTMLVVGPKGHVAVQVAFQLLLTVSRSGVEYMSASGEQSIEELQAMWELRKEDLKTISELRLSAQAIVYELYNKYHLKEEQRLTEATANLFNEYVSEPDASKRLRVLKDHEDTYKHMAEYYYYLGMAYLDLNKYQEAKLNFDRYLAMYYKTPYLRYDERTGCIALARLTYEKELSADEKVELINIVLKNLPNSSPALLQCAMIYIHDLKQYEKGFNLLRAGIDNSHASDPDILYMAVANLLPYMTNYPAIYNAAVEIFTKTNNVGYTSYLTYLFNTDRNAWNKLVKLNTFTNCNSRTWYSLWMSKDFSRELQLTLPGKVVYTTNDASIYIEYHEGDNVAIQQMNVSYKNGITEKDIDKVKCFKAIPNLRYLYIESVEPRVYVLKKNINTALIDRGLFPRQSEFALSEDDLDDIIDFCKDFESESGDTELILKDMKGTAKSIQGKDNTLFTFIGDSLRFKPFHSKQQKGYYVRLCFHNGMQIAYKYHDDIYELKPYFYYDGKKSVFWDMAAQNEYTYVERNNPEDKTQPKESSWYDKIKTWISDDEEKKQ